MKETDLAKHVVKYLRQNGWTVYQEVVMGYGGNRADIVAVKDNVVWVIEAKVNFGFAVLAQAERWLAWTNCVSVAVPRVSYSEGRTLGRRIAKDLGIGVIDVDTLLAQESMNCVQERVEPQHRLGYTEKLLKCCTAAHEDFCPAGTPKGGYVTCYKLYCEMVLEYLKKEPGQTPKQIVAAIGHGHYCSDISAQVAIAQRAQWGQIAGVRADKSTRPMKLYSTEH